MSCYRKIEMALKALCGSKAILVSTSRCARIYDAWPHAQRFPVRGRDARVPNARDGRPLRESLLNGAVRLRGGGAQHAGDVPLRACGVRLLLLTWGISSPFTSVLVALENYPHWTAGHYYCTANAR
jgi:hypothetical protein